MKKFAFIVLAGISLTILGCNNTEEKAAEEVSMDQAVEQMTQALDTANAVVSTDTTAH